MSRRALSVTVTAVSALVVAVGIVLDPRGYFPWIVPGLATLVVGGLLTYRVPSNRVGWLLLLFAVATAWSALLSIVQALLFEDPDSTVVGWLDAFGYLVNTPLIVYPLGAVLLRFPNGRLLTPRWRWAEGALIATAAIGGTAALLNGGWGGDPAQALAPSPLMELFDPLGEVLSTVFYVGMSISMGVAAISVIVRYRRSRGDELLQMKWLAYAGGFLFAVFGFLFVLSGVTGEAQLTLRGGTAFVVALAFAGIPVAVAIAILRYRLYDIDVVISRTVVLAVLAGFITLVYALVVVGLGYVVGGDSDGLLLPIAATAIVAFAFEPVRHLSQGWANRLVYGRRATPYEVLADLTEQLSHGEEGEGLLGRMAKRLGDGTGAERATIWLGAPGEMVLGASWPRDPASSYDPDPTSKQVFPVTHDGVFVGAFEVIKSRGSALSSAERNLINDLAGSAGAVLGYQRLNDSLAVKAAELTRSRARLVDAQDRERRRLERDLHDGAQQLIVALKVKIGLARTMAAKHGAVDLENLLGGLGEEAQEALEEVRSLAKGIYPPVLESDGLGSALSAMAAGSPEEVVLHCDGLRRYERDIEAAVYFEISEAVTNAIKHASGPIHVELVGSEHALVFSIQDSGPGFDVASSNGGSGLQNLRDRMDAVGGNLEIASIPGTGTTVRGSVPLATLAV